VSDLANCQSSQRRWERLFHGLDLFFGPRRQESSFCAVLSDAMSRDHEGQCSVQVLMDDRFASSQGGAPLGKLNLNGQVVKTHCVIPVNGALTLNCYTQTDNDELVAAQNLMRDAIFDPETGVIQ